MKRNTTLIPLRCAALGAALFLCAAGASAQLVKWVDAKGVVHYSDKAPPADAKPAEIKAPASGGPAVTLPYELAQAARRHPVVLYTSSQCPACDLGRTLLKTRGIPFTEKTVSTDADAAALKEAGGTGLPLLLVGRSKVTGFENTEWQGMLTAAAYPAERMLPPAYQYQVAAAAPVPAAAPSIAVAVEPERTSPPRRKAPPAQAETPPGFQF